LSGLGVNRDLRGPLPTEGIGSGFDGTKDCRHIALTMPERLRLAIEEVTDVKERRREVRIP